ncbi:D-alanyl-D-alanine carboxypeptidase OS=Streptomyces antimycoticus OX=68175 GN=SANT12839_098600 PE=4 SV=1 [Streptomyces antimycoticus]
MGFGLGVVKLVHPVAGTVWAYEGATWKPGAALYFPKTGMIIAIAVNSAVGEGDTLPDLAGTVYKTLSAQKAQALPRHQ